MRIKYAEYKKNNMLYKSIEGTYNEEDKTIEVEEKNFYIYQDEIIGTFKIIKDKDETGHTIVHIIYNNSFKANFFEDIFSLSLEDYRKYFPDLVKAYEEDSNDEAEILSGIKDELQGLMDDVELAEEELLEEGTLVKVSLEDFVKGE